MPDSGSARRRVLAIVSRFNAHHIDYLAALGRHVELRIAVNRESERGTVAQAVREGLPVTIIGSIGLQKIAARLHQLLADWRPDVVYTLWDTNEELTILVRRLVGNTAIVVYKCSDPLTTVLGMTTSSPGPQPGFLEREALRCSDGHIFVTKAIRIYLEETHQLDLSQSSLIVPHGFAARTVAPPAWKLSADDGRVHLALVGFANPNPDHGRYYINIIRRLVSLGLVIHSHFHEVPGVSNQLYRDLATALADYHYHPTFSNRDGTQLSHTISRYDLMGVFHELEATRLNESAVLEVCLPSKAQCGWLHGGIPVVCFAQYRGVAEFIQEFGIGFVIERWEDLQGIATDRAAIARATDACLRNRYRFTHEWNAERIIAFFEQLIDQSPMVSASLENRKDWIGAVHNGKLE